MINLHCVLNNFKNDSRVLKITKTLSHSGFFQKVCIVALNDGASIEREDLDQNRSVWRVPLRSRKLSKNVLVQTVKYAEWLYRILRNYGAEVRVIHCHDLSTLLVGVVYKRLYGSKLVYDAHELETEVEGLTGVRKTLYSWWERRLIQYPEEIITVSDAIAQWYRDRYRLDNVRVVKNVPEKTPQSCALPVNLKETLGLGQGDLLFIYQGGVSRGRGVEPILEAFTRLTGKAHIVFMGSGPLEGAIKEYQRDYPNIHFHPSVAPEQVLHYTRTADVGIHLIQNSCLNHYYCLPNKVYEYLLSGLPMVVSNFPEMSRVVNQHGVGWTTEPRVDAVVALIEGITAKDVAQRRNNAAAVGLGMGWESEAATVVAIYRGLLR